MESSIQPKLPAHFFQYPFFIWKSHNKFVIEGLLILKRRPKLYSRYNFFFLFASNQSMKLVYLQVFSIIHTQVKVIEIGKNVFKETKTLKPHSIDRKYNWHYNNWGQKILFKFNLATFFSIQSNESIDLIIKCKSVIYA